MKYYDSHTDSWTTKGDWLKVEQVGSTEIVTKADHSYKNSFQVTFNKFDGDVTRKAMLLVHNGGSEVECDTILVRHVITYPGTDLEAVEYKGKFWAPVNCGGSTDLTTADKITEDTRDVAILGYCYQWGRNVPFTPGSVATVSPVGSLPLYIEACLNTGPYQDKLIVTTYDEPWFRDYRSDKPDGLSSALTRGGDDVWPRENQPCPAGWRVSTQAEWQGVADEMKDNGEYLKDGKWVSRSNNKFVLTITALYYGFNGAFNSPTNSGNYWTSAYGTASLPVKFRVSTDLVELSAYNGEAMPVRCVKE